MAEDLDGLISFFASHHAIRAEKVMRAAGLAAELVPGPKDLSPNCGVAVRFVYAERDAALGLLAEHHVKVDAVHPYRSRVDDWKRPTRDRTPRFLRRGRS